MAGFIARGKEIIANIQSKDQTEPGTPYFKDVKDAFIRAYPTKWIENLARKGLVINPANLSDPLDIGTFAAQVFTPADNPTKNRTTSFHFIDCMRQFVKQTIVSDQKNIAIASGDAGSTPEQVRQSRRTAAASTADTNLGDADSDTDT